MLNKKRLYLICIITLVITGVLMCNVDKTEAFEGLGMSSLCSDKDIITFNMAASDGKNGASFGIFFSGGSSDDDIFGIDIGYNRAILKHLIIGLELSIGHKTHLPGHEEESSGELSGIGITVDIPIIKTVKIMSSFGSVKGTSVGIGMVLSF